jgi:hypothetical protein
MKTAEQVMGSLIDELSRTAHTTEDQARLEAALRHWATVREHRERKELKILMLSEELRIEDEQFAALLDERSWQHVKGERTDEGIYRSGDRPDH